jgi:hypothetical protein
MYELCNLWAKKIDENRYHLWEALPLTKIEPHIWYDWYDTATKQFGQCRADEIVADKNIIFWHQAPIGWYDRRADIVVLGNLGIFINEDADDHENEEEDDV